MYFKNPENNYTRKIKNTKKWIQTLNKKISNTENSISF